ncbi:glycoside hydrolase family 66 protein [Paenibacillus psychroresistens]|nr:glycoside hydrolase family 66 protein [Paenibacillus psychroresistens]
MTKQHLIQLIPSKAQYKPNEEIVLYLHSKLEEIARYQWCLYDLEQLILSGEGEIRVGITGIEIPTISTGSGAYGVFVKVTNGDNIKLEAETAFDIAEHWHEAPRYGFLSDFKPGEAADNTDVEFLNKHHINIVQFYDWMYRHDQLVPEVDDFTDPLGREISLQVVREKIAGLREHGIASMAYAAVYASLADYAAKFPDQVLYRNDGVPYSLGSFFYIMDISTDSAWTPHIIAEFLKVLELGFDGLHLDQYGMPKKAIRTLNGKKEVVALKQLYPAFINRTREVIAPRYPVAGLIFNNVSNYPVHTTANALQDIIYIEVWDPMTYLRDLKQLIDRARELSGKQVVLAAYLPAFHPERAAPLAEAEFGATLVMATIFASGGYHLLLGEQENVLTEGYYPKYGFVSDRFKQTLTFYYDFIVMYRHLLYDFQLEDISLTFSGGINTEISFHKDDIIFSPNQHVNSVWTIVKEKPGYLILHAINLIGLDNDVWHQGKKQAPAYLDKIEVTIEMLEEIEGVYWATPDGNSIQAKALDYNWVTRDDYNGRYIRFVLPELSYWSMVYVKTKHGVATA